MVNNSNSEQNKNSTENGSRDISDTELYNIALRSFLYWKKEVRKMLKSTKCFKKKIKLMDLESKLGEQITNIKRDKLNEVYLAKENYFKSRHEFSQQILDLKE